MNPKDKIGATKISISKVPMAGLIHEAHAMMRGAELYQPFNWRDTPVQASIYVDACMRHLMAWFEREEVAADSGVHHLGHARACLGILLDAIETNKLVDDRPKISAPIGEILERLSAAIKEKRQQNEQKKVNEKLDAVTAQSFTCLHTYTYLSTYDNKRRCVSCEAML